MDFGQKKGAPKKKRGPDAHGRLLEAGIDVFGQHGFSAATTRMIAEAAGVNIAAIPYYFSSKQGLYQAVVEHIAGQLESKVKPTLQEIEAKAQTGHLNRQEAMALLEKLLEKMIDFMVGSPEAPRFVRIVLREQIYPSAVYDVIFSRIMDPLLSAIAKMVGLAIGALSSRAALLRALSLMGQIMAFRVARETMIRKLGVKGYSPEETMEIRQVILEQTRAALQAMSPPGER
jgi:AcrR family transcriptional regulator